MSDKDDSFSSLRGQVDQTTVKQLPAYVNVHRTQRIVQQVDVSITVQCPGQADALLLTSTQVDATLTDLTQRTHINILYINITQEISQTAHHPPVPKTRTRGIRSADPKKTLL